MKKAKMIGKKTLSVFLAVLMVLTAWVWVAPSEASAVNAGTYDVQIKLVMSDTAALDQDETDKLILYHKVHNGTASSESTSKQTIGVDDLNQANVTYTFTGVGFPTGVKLDNIEFSQGWLSGQGTIGLTIEVYVSKNGTYTKIATSSSYSAKETNNNYFTFDYDVPQTDAPKADSIVWNAAGTTDITLSSTGSTNYTRDFKYVIKDQYGVIMSDTALSNLKTPVSYSLQSTNFPTVSNTGNIGTSSTDSPNLYHTFTNGTSEYQVSVKVNDKLRSLEDGVNERKVNLKVTCGTLSSTKSFNIYDSKHTITFDKNATDASTLTPSSYKVYYGESLASQAIIDNASTYPTSGNRTGYTFLGMYDATTGGNLMNINADVTANKTYYAHWEILKYAAVFMDRSGDNVVLVESDIEHGSAATKASDAAAKLNRVEFDDVNHYVLNESNVWTPSTDNVTGNTFFYPNYTATAHTFDNGTEISATCQHGAGMEYKCTGCDYSYVAETSETLGNHAKSDSYIVDTEATCETTGTGHYFCTTCNETVETVEIPAKGHSYKTEVTKNATCTEKGTRKYTCTVCGDSYNEEIPLLPHDYKAGETVAATCQHSAYTPYECSGCDSSYNKYEGNATTDHNWNFTSTEDTVNNKVNVTGTCSVCNATFTTEAELSHKHNFKNYEVIKQPTCKETGEIKISCADSGCTESYTATLPAVPTAHTEYETIYTPATCSAKGSVVTKCKNCTAEIETAEIATTEIAKLNHSYNYVRVEPDCTTAGSITKTCANCGDVLTEEIPATGHKTITVESNCQHGGYEKCGVCNTIISETSKKDHDFTGEVTKVEATCTVDGIKFTKCKDCDAQKAEKLTASGHSVPNDFTIIIPATCLGKGLKTKTCPKCNIVLDSKEIDPTGHNYQKDDKLSVPVTCTTAGKDVFVCKKCGDANTEVIQPLGHDWNEGVTTEATCTNSQYTTYTCQRTGCGETKIVIPDGAQALLHDFTGKETIINDATCEADGEKTVQCTRCDTTTTIIIPKLGHTWKAWIITKPATNEADGEMTRTCSNGTCTETEAIPKGGHTWDNGTITKEATCKNIGTMVYKCNNSAHTECTASYEVTIPVRQHNVVTEQREASCKEGGFIKTYCSYTDCGEEFSNKTITKLAHNYTNGEAVAPTCTTSGYTPYKCSCGDSYNEYDESKPATGHDFDETIATNVTKTEATCTVDGSKKVKCKNCDVKNEVVIPATGHSHVKDTVTAANCTTAGTEVYKCACGDTYTKFIEAAKGHTFGGWTVTQAATADQYGIQERTCSVCKTVEIGKVAPIGNHTFVEKVTKEATCTEKGEKSFTCSAHENCSANYTAEIPAKGHTQTLVYEEPTCTAIGYSKVVCSVGTCKALIMSAEIPAKGHAYNTVKVTTEAGCESTGIRTYSCSCGASYTETIPSKGHNYVSTVTVATCEKAGEVVTTCSSCGVSTTETLAALNHKWNEGVENPKATCTSTGTKTYTCTVAGCGKTKTETVKALGHNWGDWKVTPSTNNATGSVSRKCLADNCDGTETITIPAGGHNLVVDEVNSSDATCTEKGTITYICDNHKGNANCGVTLTVTVPATGHNVNVTTAQADCTNDGSVVETCKYCNTVIKTTVIPKKGHTVTVTTTPATCIKEGSVVEDCDNCDYKVTTPLPIIPHDYRGEEINKVDATCTADGSKTIQCKTEGCTATTTVIIPHTGHTWNAWTITKPATNTADGEMTRTCSNGTCTETVVIPKGGHIWDNGTVTKDATCTETGTMVYKCNNADHGNCTASYEVAISIKEHTIAQREIESTCKVEGSVEAYCSKCNRVLSTETIPVKAHVYKAGTAVAPTCTTSGYTPYKCSCGDTYNVYDATKPANGHTLVEGTSTATCTEGGVMTLKCENCTYSRTVNVPALGHNYVENEKAETKATCAAAATKTYECSRCTASYTISVGEKLTNYDAHQWTAWITVESATNTSLGYKTRTCEVCNKMEVETIAATGEHKFDKLISEKAATCEGAGEKIYACSTHTACGETSTITLPALGHTKTLDYEKATCTKAGYTKIICSVEGCDYEEKATEIPALGHDWNSGYITNATCNTKGEIVRTCSRGCTDTDVTTIPVNSNAHQYATEYIAATCYKEGSVVTKCKLCGNTTTNETLAQLQHTWDSGSETTSATCLDVGIKTYKCACDATKTEDIPALGHSWSEWTETKASTNSDKGEMKRSCERDGCTASETVEIPAGGHNFENAPVINKDASCTAVGSATYKCSAHENCGVEVDVVLPMLQHELEKSEQAASCDTDGFVTVKCKNCDTATYTTVIPKTGCAWNEGEITKAATCTEEGTMTFTCAYNADHKYTKQIAKTQHNYKAGTPVAATCTSNGYTPYKCETCDSSYVILDAGAPAKGHTFNTVVSSTATCTEGGVMTLKCACGKTMETQVPALGHDYQFSVATMATCAEAATETFKCSRCADSYIVSVGSKTNNHDWNDWVIVKATNTSLGYQTRTCKACDKLELEIIPATGEHKFDTETNDKKAETCTEGGYIVYACSTHDDCGLTSKVTIPAKGHTEQLMYSAPSCTVEGSTSIYCDVCKTTLSSKTIDKLDHVFEVESIKSATCKTEGLITLGCKNCNTTKPQTIAVDSTAHKLKTTVNLATCKEAGSVTVTCENGCTYEEETAIPMLQHSWGKWSVTTPSTNSTEGEMTRCCGSGCSETVKIPAGGHAFGDTPDSTTPASCTAEGSATYNCTAHTNCGVTITVKTEKLQHTLVTDSKASNCTESGYVKVYCSECKKEYSNMTFGKLAHDYTVVVEKFDATCTTAGHTILKCVNCDAKYDRFDAQPNGHDFDESIEENVKTVPATCDIDGSKTVKCKNCDATNVTVIPATGHEYKDEKAIVETKPTCTEMGYTTYTCDICRSSYTTNFVNPTGHKYTSVVTAPTCTASGYTTYTCTCGESYISNPVSPTGHNFDEKIEGNVTIVSADCEADGLKTVKCNNCDATNVTVLPATGHDYDVNNDGKINLDDAEMIDGEFVYVCQNAGCSHKVKAEDDEDDTDSFTVRFFDGNGEQVGEDRIVLAGEKATAPAETPAKDADGNYHYTFSGWDRDFSEIDKDLDVYATFEREAHYGGEAVCYAKAVCDKCGVGYGEFDATKHIIVTKSKSATCEADGWIEYYCSVEICGYHYSTGNYLKKETIGASGHVYGQWTIVQNGTCEIPQIQQRRCVNVGCNKIDEKRTQSTHTWMIEPKINPTCSSVGYTEFKYCLTCNLQIDRVEIPKTDHKDLDGNGYCDYCGTSKGTPKCNCMCHSTGIMKLFYGIVKFFWKLTKSSRSCSCGAVHY